MKLDNVADAYPLSPMQAGMLYHHILTPDSGAHVDRISFLLDGRLDVTALKECWSKIVERHATLRTMFLWEGIDEPLQIVRQSVDVPWLCQDWRERSSAEQAESCAALLKEDRAHGFDLTQAPIMRMHLLRLSEERWQWIWCVHHLLADGWSAMVLLEELLSTYGAACRGESQQHEPPFQYRDYIQWLSEQDLDKAEKFWREQLAGFDQPTMFRIANSGSLNTDLGYGQQHRQVDTSTTERLRTFAKRNRITLNTAILGAWSILVSRYSGHEDVVYGTTVAGRPAGLPSVEKAVGLFLNTLPLRTVVREDAPLGEWLKHVQKQQLDIRQHEYSPLASVQKWSDVDGGQPLFDSIVAFENYPRDSALKTEQLCIQEIQFTAQSSFPLALLVEPRDKLELVLVYDRSRFTDDAVTRMLEHLLTLIASFIDAEQVADCSMLPEGERQQLDAWNHGEPAQHDGICLHQMIELAALRDPDAIAVVFEQGELTYRELMHRTDRIAARLQLLGVGPGVCVGLFVDRGIEMVVGMLAILKAGGAYVPLDPTYPDDHLQFIVRDAQIDVIVTQTKFLGTLPSSTATAVCVDEETAAIEHVPDVATNPDNLAYVIYTSGSTGKPKGVLVTHSNIVHSTMARTDYYGEQPGRFMLLSSFAFDSSMVGIFWTLCSGGTLVLPRTGLEQDINALLELFATRKVTHTLCLPSLYDVLLKHGVSNQLDSLTTVIVAGETCQSSVVTRHYEQLPTTSLYNEYGPTETTVWNTVYRTNINDGNGPIPIGKAIQNTQAFVLDKHLRAVPIGVTGELFLGGAGVARGYLNQPELEAERFVAHPTAPHERLYRTGDLACYRPDGNLLFLGRADTQLKVRGYRIEPSEVESALREHRMIGDAVVVASDGRSTTNIGDDAAALCDALATFDRDVVDVLLSRLESLPQSTPNEVVGGRA